MGFEGKDRSARGQETPRQTPAPEAPSAGRDALRGKGYAAGALQLKPATPRGTGTVVASAGTTEFAYESQKGTFTTQLAKAIDDDPKTSVADLLRSSASKSAAAGAGVAQHATITEVAGDGQAARGKGHGVYVANTYKDHPLLPSLEATVSDAEAIRTSLGGRGFTDHGLHVDKPAADIRKAYTTALGSADVKPGDDVVLYYSGHGSTSGLVGSRCDEATLRQAMETQAPSAATTPAASGSTDARGIRVRRVGSVDESSLIPNDLVTPSEVQGLVSSGTSRGVNVTMVSDSCNSGSLTDALRAKSVADVSKAAKGTGAEELAALAKVVVSLKDKVLAFLGIQSAQLGTLDAGIAKAAGSRGLVLDTQPTPETDQEKELRLAKEKKKAEWAAEAERFWKSDVMPLLVEKAARYSQLAGGEAAALPASVSNPNTFGAELDAIDDLANQILSAASRKLATTKSS